ncbi:hypothetical protein ACHWQZ_G003495 [Mnemiopsis leidyi]
MSVLLETSLGDIVIDLYTKDRPRSTLNFLKLCKLKMYNYCLIHSVQRNFVIQTGDIDQKGGSSIFKVLYGDQAKLFEKEQVPKLKHNKKFTVSMVNDGNGYHGSQFLITTTENADALDGLHTVFGIVTEGEDVVTQINEAYCDEKGRPYQDIRINHTIVLHDPHPDPETLPIPPRSPSPPPSVLESDRLAVGEAVNTMTTQSTEEVIEYIEEKELKANTQMLEIIGDIPDADMKPPEDVLFVCKLNPVTTSDDLEIIFSRFGAIESCEVIRDWKTGDSLCYAFIQFAEVASCEAAYFKMDNVLIDERRIHVDFSQSVSKLYWSRNTKNQIKYNSQSNSGVEKTRDVKSSNRPQNGNTDNDKPDSRRYNSNRYDNRSRSGRSRGHDHFKSTSSSDKYERNHHEDKSRRNDNEYKSRKNDQEYKSRRNDEYKSKRNDHKDKSRGKDHKEILQRNDYEEKSRKDHEKSRRDMLSERKHDQDYSKPRYNHGNSKRSYEDDKLYSRRENEHYKSKRGNDSIESRGDEKRSQKRVSKQDFRDSDTESNRDIKVKKRDKNYEREYKNSEQKIEKEDNKDRKRMKKDRSCERPERKKEVSESVDNNSSDDESSQRKDTKPRRESEKKKRIKEDTILTEKKNKSNDKEKARELQQKISDLQKKIKKMKEEETSEESSSSSDRRKKHKKAKLRK